MKKFNRLISTVVFMMLVLAGCSSGVEVQYREVYSEVMGFSLDNELYKPVPEDAVLLLSKDEYETFAATYFKPRETPIPAPDPAKAVLYLQVSSQNTMVNQYGVDRISLQGNTLSIHIKQSGSAQVEAAPGFNGTWKWVMLLEIDKANLKEDLKLQIIKPGSNQPAY